MIKLNLLIAFFSGFGILNAQQIIPFKLTEHNNIIIKTLVNDKDSLDLMFQVAMQDAAISPQKTKPADHIKFDDNNMSHSNRVNINGLNFENVTFFNNELSGPESDGKIGTGIFKGKIFEINYDNKQLLIHDKMPDLSTYKPIAIDNKNEAFYIMVDSFIDGDFVTESFYMQSGYAGTLLFSNPFAEKNQLENKLKVTSEQTLSNAAGQKMIAKRSEITELKIGNFKLKNIKVGYFGGELKTQAYSMFGGDLIKRFNWIFDAERKTAYIKPSKYFEPR